MNQYASTRVVQGRTSLALSAALAAALAAVPAVLASKASHACGACDEDKIAATYDHAVVQRATARGDVMVYCAVSGPLDAPRLRQVAGRVRGVEPHSVRVSSQPAALSFAVDPGVLTPQAAIDAVQRGVPSDVHLSLVRLLVPEPARVR